MAPKNDGQSRCWGGTAREGDHPPCTKRKRRKGGDTLAVVVRPCRRGDGVRHRPPSINAGMGFADGGDRLAASGTVLGSNVATGPQRAHQDAGLRQQDVDQLQDGRCVYPAPLHACRRVPRSRTPSRGPALCQHIAKGLGAPAQEQTLPSPNAVTSGPTQRRTKKTDR